MEIIENCSSGVKIDIVFARCLRKANQHKLGGRRLDSYWYCKKSSIRLQTRLTWPTWHKQARGVCHVGHVSCVTQCTKSRVGVNAKLYCASQSSALFFKALWG